MEINPTNKSKNEYLNKTKDIGPRENMLEALKFCKNKGEALDMGSGAFSDSKYLIKIGFKNVTAVDLDDISKYENIEIPKGNFNFIVSTFENFNFEKNKYDFINAQRCLSFSPRKSFKDLLKNIEVSLKKDGIFCGNIFGLETDFPNKNNGAYFSFDDTRNLLSIFEILDIKEVSGKSAVGNKDVQRFDFICRKKNYD